jgi:uncharacterized damage-inducible protein DinB
MVRLETVLESWRTIREDTAAAVEQFPAGEFDFRPAEGVMTFGETARHILEAGEGLSGLLLEGEENFKTPDFRDKLRKHMPAVGETPGPETLVRELRQRLAARIPQLAAQPPEFYSKIITRFDGQQVTRLELLQFIKEHELTHRAQLFMCLRLRGIVPPTTKRREVAKKS